jgi:ribonucleoside-diphosphate reductase alpha chain
MKYLGVNVPEIEPQFINEFSKTLLEDFYVGEDETVNERLMTPAGVFSYGDYDFANRIAEYVFRGWLVYSSPVLSNAPKITWDKKYEVGSCEAREFLDGSVPSKHKGLPISCFLVHVGDTILDQKKADDELASMSVAGGGVGEHLMFRGVTKKSPGSIPYIVKNDGAIQYYKQGETRKGSVAHYLDVNHPDIMEFIHVRDPNGGDFNRKAFNTHNAVNVTDEFLDAVDNDLDINLVQPHNNEVVETISARKIWQAILNTRYKTGEPYINYVSEANRRMPIEQKVKGLKIHGSNLCNEIMLPTDEQRSAVCCLSSVNLALYDEWKDDDLFIEDCVRFLDNVLQYFIDMAPESLDKAIYSAKQERAIGLGTLGWHTYLQKKGIPWESGGFNSAIQHTNIVFKNFADKCDKANLKLGSERGEAPDMVGTGKRCSVTRAIAPNANSGIIAGVSASIEPLKSNAYVHRTRAGSFLVKNKVLDTVLRGKLKDFENLEQELESVWSEIVLNDGSVQDCGLLSDEEKEVFKTFKEIDMIWVIEQARHRQQYIDQGVSLNTMWPAQCSKKYFNKVHRYAFSRNGPGVPVKGLYYSRTEKASKADNVSVKIQRQVLADYETQEINEPECRGCD